MVDPEKDIQVCLAILRDGGWVHCRASCGEGLITDATEIRATLPVSDDSIRPPIILLAEERELYTMVAAPDPSVLDFLDSQSPNTAIVYPGVLGIAPAWLDPSGAAAIMIAPDIFLRHLVKRLQSPLVWLTVSPSIISLAPFYAVTTPDYSGPSGNITVFGWENGQPLPA